MKIYPVKVKIYNKSITLPLPEYKTEHSVGLDLFANVQGYSYKGIREENGILYIEPLQTVLIHTGLYVEIPEGYELQIRSRSGVSLKLSLIVTNAPGTIDSDYRGEIGIIVTNLNLDMDVEIEHRDRIAQAVLKRYERIEWVEVENYTDLEETHRGTGGFGSTGEK